MKHNFVIIQYNLINIQLAIELISTMQINIIIYYI